MIPDIEKFKQDEEKEITKNIPNCIFKDEEKLKHQNEKAFRIEEMPIQDSKSIISINRNTISLDQDVQVEDDLNNNNNITFNINKDKDKDKAEGVPILLNKKKLRNYTLNQGIEGNEIEVKINCDDNNESLKRFFLKTV